MIVVETDSRTLEFVRGRSVNVIDGRLFVMDEYYRAIAVVNVDQWNVAYHTVEPSPEPLIGSWFRLIDVPPGVYRVRDRFGAEWRSFRDQAYWKRRHTGKLSTDPDVDLNYGPFTR